MATTTTNLGLRKPAKTDYVNVVTDLNDNMDTIDSSVNAAQEAVAIMSNGNIHIAVSAGEYLYVRNHGSLSEGLYKATEAIAQNGTLSSSNTAAVSKGLGGQVTVLNNKVGSVNSAKRGTTNTTTGTYSFQMNNGTHGIMIIGSTAIVPIGMTNGGSLYNGTMPSGYSISQSGSTVTVTKTSSVSTAQTITILLIE